MIHGYSSHFPKSARLNPTRQVKVFDLVKKLLRNFKLLTIESLKKSHHLFVYETFVFPHISRYTKFFSPPGISGRIFNIFFSSSLHSTFPLRQQIAPIYWSITNVTMEWYWMWFAHFHSDGVLILFRGLSIWNFLYHTILRKVIICMILESKIVSQMPDRNPRLSVVELPRANEKCIAICLWETTISARFPSKRGTKRIKEDISRRQGTFSINDPQGIGPDLHLVFSVFRLRRNRKPFKLVHSQIKRRNMNI